ncbi:hypothetical protein [Ruixingdingia sedimenti]|uniref:Uncharacterized protein n=1 Tax=Ruixingdingia sedimenti TaxID=3073604 RepID=A0ABU1F3G6_9RHOB|nr:hypothetical protein [Xinfangfangia sp. LG-4]MDR5650994.1 hypothetical protein [Xinfangfangia sp. LG-4]
MRDFFIRSFELIVGVVIVVAALGVLIGGLMTMFAPQGGFLQGIAIWVAGAIYVLFLGGAMYLGLGIYQNTRRTAEALERLAERG